jgi:putative redox protein
MQTIAGNEKGAQDTERKYTVNVNWVRKMQFIASDDRNHSIVVDTSTESGGENTGPTPGRLLLMAVAACTAIDVVDILTKSKQLLRELQVSSRGIQNEEYPKYYKEIHLKYLLRGNKLDKSRVERAIKLSEEKYCSVGATVSGKAKIFTHYAIEDEPA